MQNQTIIKPGYKFIPHLGEIPEDWEVKKMDNISKIFLGLTYTPTYTANGIPFLSVKDINGGKINLDDSKRISYDEFNSSTDNAKPKKGDILFGRVGSLGKPIIIDFEEDFCIFVSLGFLRIKDQNQTSNLFVKNWMQSNLFIKQIDSRVAGGAQKNLNTGWLKSFYIGIPPIKEQQKIASILNICDSQIEATKQIIKKLEIRNKGLQQQLLTGKMRLPGFSEEWREISLKKCLNYEPRGIPKPSEKYLALGVRSHGKGMFHKPNSNPEDIAMNELFIVKENDLVVNITFAWEQAIAIASKKDEGGLVSHRFPTYTFKTEIAIHDYFRYLIIQKRFKYNLDLISPGGAGRNRVLSKKDFLKMKVTIPDIKEQKAIANILDKVNMQFKDYKNKLKKLELQKRGLMQQLLTGKTRVKI